MEQIERRKDDEKWHLKKEVSIGQIFAILAVAIGLITSWSQMDKRITVVESELAHSRLDDARIEQQLRETVSRIEASLVRIETALKEKQDKVK